MLSITRQISKYNHSDGNNIQYLVVHDTGCPTTDTAKNNADYFGGGDRQASAHYFVDETSIYQVVEESQASWHCGDGGDAYGIGNHNSIGIEMCKTNGSLAEATIKNSIDLIKSLMSKYNLPIDKVVRHYDASHKICPSSMSANNWAKWYDFKNRLNGGSASNMDVTTSVIGTNLELQQLLNKLGYKGLNGLSLVEDGDIGGNSINAIKSFQKDKNLTVDGNAGTNTWTDIRKAITDLNKPVAPIVATPTPQPIATPTFVVPSNNDVLPTGSNITPLNGGGWIERVADGRTIVHQSKSVYLALTADGHLDFTANGVVKRLA